MNKHSMHGRRHFGGRYQGHMHHRPIIFGGTRLFFPLVIVLFPLMLMLVGGFRGIH